MIDIQNGIDRVKLEFLDSSDIIKIDAGISQTILR